MKLASILRAALLPGLVALVGCSDDRSPADGGVRDASADASLTPDANEDAATPDAGALDAAADDASARDGAVTDAGAPAPALETFVADVARSTCGALFRCCDSGDLDEFFAPIRRDGENDWALASFRPRLPPDATSFDETACATVLAEIYAIMPFGDWVREATAGHVTFRPAEHAACLAALDGAACGEPARAALWDSTCFAFLAPFGEQRAMFERTATAGECAPIADGIGARIYGTCDPDEAFCCFRPASDPTAPCWLAGDDRVGTCAAAAQLGEPCSFDFAARSAQFCATGLDCDDSSADPSMWRCVASAPTTPLAIGQRCAEDFTLLGECIDGWCDLLGTGLCEELVPDLEPCGTPEACTSGRCIQNVCQPNDVCSMR
ncbi:hypothetical protein L6R52_08790 [Myxococcota bacterium]|nr:hypothetical protein [Myxococcota bacterium]